MFGRRRSEPRPQRKPRIIAASPVGVAMAVAERRRLDRKAVTDDAAVQVTAAEHRPSRYTRTASLLHWLIALGVVVMLPLGLAMKRAPFALEAKLKLYQLHKSIGLTILALMLARVVWRLGHAPPPLPAGFSVATRGLAHAVHLLLYMLLLALPIAGWLLTSSAALPIPTRFFDVFTVPHLPALATLPAEARRVWELFFGQLHSLSALALGLLITLHVLAALRHQRRGVDILARMLPWRRTAAKPPIRVATLLLALAAAVALAPPLAAAGPPAWTVDPKASSLTFAAMAGGQAVTGRFPQIEARIRLDPEKPETAEIEIRIVIAALTTGTAEVDAALQAIDWFDAKAHPIAVFRSKSAERTAAGFLLAGEIALRGTTRRLAVPFKLALDGRRATATGEVTLDRNDFGIGPRDPIAGIAVAPEVRIALKIVADRAE
jgi:cytochrome b561/polyisoprenoid-binding protein YceI